MSEGLSEAAFYDLELKLAEGFAKADIPAVIRLIDSALGTNRYTLENLFRDDQRRILDAILRNAVDEAEETYRRLHERNAPIAGFLRDFQTPLPKVFRSTAEFAINRQLRDAAEDTPFVPTRFRQLLSEALAAGIDLDKTTLEFAFRCGLEKDAAHLAQQPRDDGALLSLYDKVALLAELPFAVDLWRVQNDLYLVAQRVYHEVSHDAGKGDRDAARWLAAFDEVIQRLKISV